MLENSTFFKNVANFMINSILIGSIDPLGLIDGIDLPIPLEFLKMLPAFKKTGFIYGIKKY